MEPQFLVPKPSKPIRDDSCLFNSSSRDDEDNCSLDANTNLNWCTGETVGKRRKLKDDCSEYTLIPSQNQKIKIEQEKKCVNQITAQEFYTSSHYFIDQLKDEYFVCKDGEWYTSKANLEADFETFV
mmetsp:Transcript_17404/g.26817  ORF Transcript_17404/g.26817 Transcript_17404/m.26817 type:complete len:127 (-) Transcript_17404:857-1237(-)